MESLSTKAFSEPPSIDQIADLFQEFYIRASSSISIHIAALRLKLNRESSPAPPKGSNKPRSLSNRKSNDSLAPSGSDGSQMLTASEVTERRKQRRLLDYKKLVLEEAVERRACEKVYDKLWRHKSTLDDEKDEKLRSKTAALALVGIGLRDLGVEVGDKSSKTIEDIQESLAPAREGLMKMNDEHYPLGKLEHLTGAHKVIVDILYSVHGSSSSADEILPTLIYTLISAPVEGINIISNLNFIQRFRASNKIDGEAAYCLTNLEAAIGFLDEVDLTTLRADELPEGPRRISSGQQTPTIEKLEPFPSLSSQSAPSTATTTTEATGKPTVLDRPNKSLSVIRPPPSPRHQRTLSELLKPVQSANDAVRATAKEGLDNISNTLDNSLKFFLGRFKEHASDPTKAEDMALPRTLDEARQLVNRPVTPELGEENVVISENSSVAGDQATDSPEGMTEKDKLKSNSDDKLLSLFGGRKVAETRDRSVDRESLRSNSSNKKVAFVNDGSTSSSAQAKPAATSSTPPTGNPLDAVRNFGGSLNPLGHIGNAFGSTFKGFGRPAAPAQPQTPSDAKANKAVGSLSSSKEPSSETSLITEAEPKIAIFLDKPEDISTKIKTVSPPIQKFMDTQDASELQIKDISVLLADYQRLAGLLNELATHDIESPAVDKT